MTMLKGEKAIVTIQPEKGYGSKVRNPMNFIVVDVIGSPPMQTHVIAFRAMAKRHKAHQTLGCRGRNPSEFGPRV